MKKELLILSATLGLGLLTACNDKDFCDLPHPYPGQALLTPEWKEVLPPTEKMTLLFGLPDGTTTIMEMPTSGSYQLTDRAPGTYQAFAYNAAEHIHIEGNLAQLDQNPDGTLPEPGPLYYGHTSFRIEPDKQVSVSLPMLLQTRLLQISLNLSGEQPDRVIRMEGKLTGIADTRTLPGLPVPDAPATAPASRADTGSSRPGSIPLTFVRTDDELKASYRLLGIDIERRQILTLVLTYKNGKQESQTYELTQQLAGFNDDGFTPSFHISASFVLLPPEPDEPDNPQTALTPGFKIIGWGTPLPEEGNADMEL